MLRKDKKEKNDYNRNCKDEKKMQNKVKNNRIKRKRNAK